MEKVDLQINFFLPNIILRDLVLLNHFLLIYCVLSQVFIALVITTSLLLHIDNVNLIRTSKRRKWSGEQSVSLAAVLFICSVPSSSDLVQVRHNLIVAQTKPLT